MYRSRLRCGAIGLALSVIVGWRLAFRSGANLCGRDPGSHGRVAGGIRMPTALHLVPGGSRPAAFYPSSWKAYSQLTRR